MAAIFLVLALSSLTTAKITSNASRYPSFAADLVLGQPLEGFVSFSIEFSSFPDFAGESYMSEVSFQ